MHAGSEAPQLQQYAAKRIAKPAALTSKVCGESSKFCWVVSGLGKHSGQAVALQRQFLGLGLGSWFRGGRL